MSYSDVLPISISGKVVHGRQLGRTIGMPTANIYPEVVIDLPYGVYYSKVYVGNDCYKGISNIGTKPTVQNEFKLNIETYLYDFHDDLYEKEITVELLEFKRPEIKFDSFKALSDQMHKDMEDGQNY